MVPAYGVSRLNPATCRRCQTLTSEDAHDSRACSHRARGDGGGLGGRQGGAAAATSAAAIQADKIRDNLYLLRGGGRIFEVNGMTLPQAGKTVAFVTGHYPGTLTMADLKTYGDFTREFVEAVQAAKKSGRTIDDFVNTWKLPARYLKDGYNDFSQLRSIRPDVEAIWNESR